MAMKIPKRNRKTPIEAEWEQLDRRERNFCEQRQQKKENMLNRVLDGKVPEKLQHTLEGAFEKAFAVMFEKGTGVLEKTYNKETMEQEYKINRYADEVRGSRKSLHIFSKKAEQMGKRSMALSGAAGVGMGVLGIGIPDIPVFTGMVLRNIYETALNYGFDYESKEERYFILLLLEGAVSYGEDFEKTDYKIEQFIKEMQLPEGYAQESQISQTSHMLSGELLYMKFIQGIPLVGVVGGVSDMTYMKQISEYAGIKYRKRFLLGYPEKK